MTDESLTQSYQVTYYPSPSLVYKHTRYFTNQQEAQAFWDAHKHKNAQYSIIKTIRLNNTMYKLTEIATDTIIQEEETI